MTTHGCESEPYDRGIRLLHTLRLASTSLGSWVGAERGALEVEDGKAVRRRPGLAAEGGCLMAALRIDYLDDRNAPARAPSIGWKPAATNGDA